MKAILHNLSQYITISEQAKTKLAEIIVLKNYTKGSILLKEGEVCQSLNFLKTGLVRGFFNQKGKDITSWFAMDNDVATPLYSFVTRKPSSEIMEIMEDSEVYSVSYDDIQQLYRQFPEFNLVGRVLTEKYYVELMARTMSFQFQSAKERYLQLLAHRPELLQRVSLGHIASYLGISQETLSRIRAKK